MMPQDILAALPPWDAARWFQPVTETLFSGALVQQQILTGDPMRVAIGFSAFGQNAYYVSIHGGQVTGQGVAVSAQFQPAWLWFADAGPLIQQAWYATGGGVGTNLTVYTVSLRAWPERSARSKRS